LRRDHVAQEVAEAAALPATWGATLSAGELAQQILKTATTATAGTRATALWLPAAGELTQEILEATAATLRRSGLRVGATEQLSK
jgi:hypothetical protein